MKKELTTLKNFHGHIGPYLVLGYKAGRYAKDHLEIISEIKVRTYPKPAKSCILDGLQISTGCTLGRATIKIVKLSDPGTYPVITFYKNKKKLILEFNNDTKDWLEKINGRNMEKEAMKIFKTPLKKLFIIK